ncbi:MAG: class I tRNA ligase family protein, partial [Gammaproteobacteria bacterium]|nr:class I tRNA ligase family protein [Gammaproteobacteria bacterium]
MVTKRKTSLRYDPQAIDKKWQARWESDGLYKTIDDDPKPKWYALTMYPYPSGELHIGHWYAMSPADAYARFMRMKGYNVLFPMGFDAFGLPAENAAIRNKVDPSEWTLANIQRMRKQLKSMGPVFDWEREVITCDPDYYKWNQWLFLKLFEKGLAYKAEASVNWCPGCQTVLANEQVVDGKCERSDDIVIRREMAQWFLSITSYADELLDFSKVEDWPERIKSMQTNWIGRSEGVKVSFDISEYGLAQENISVFTTRIDTIFGVTFLALAPENPLVPLLTTEQNRSAVDTYINHARESSEIERLSSEREQTGIHTGSYAINKVNGERIPILVADYVLYSYGTGAVMGVPAHDERDFSFAQKNELEIRLVVAPPDWDGKSELKEAYTDKTNGILTSSGQFTGMTASDG